MNIINPEELEELYADARRSCIIAGYGSYSLLQRRLKIGFYKASALIDLLEERGVLSASDGAKPRKLLLTK